MAFLAGAPAILGISRTTLYQYVADGLITPTRLGPRMLRFDVADLEALLS